VCPDEAEERPQPSPQLLIRREVPADRVGYRLDQPERLPAQAGDEQVLLRAQVRVHHGFGDAGLLGDLVHGRGVEAAPGEDPDRGVEHLLLADGPREALDRRDHVASVPTGA
jgi:hypothetical protein